MYSVSKGRNEARLESHCDLFAVSGKMQETERSTTMFDVKNNLPKAPLYREEFEHDNCGIGACVNINGKKSRATVENALKIVENL